MEKFEEHSVYRVIIILTKLYHFYIVFQFVEKFKEVKELMKSSSNGNISTSDIPAEHAVSLDSIVQVSGYTGAGEWNRGAVYYDVFRVILPRTERRTSYPFRQYQKG